MIWATADDILNIVDRYSCFDIENASPMDGLRVALLDVYRCLLSQSEASEKITFECHDLAHEDEFSDFISDIFVNDAEIEYLLEIKKFENELYAVTDTTELKFWINTGIQPSKMDFISDDDPSDRMVFESCLHA